jgi:uracil phosphoribosyltransferase
MRSMPRVILKQPPEDYQPAAPLPPAAPDRPAQRMHVLDHPVAQHTMTQLRNRHTPPLLFRNNSQQLLLMLTLEAVRNLPTREEPVETERGLHAGQVVARPVVFLSLNRHGLGLAHSVAGILPGLQAGNISLDRAPDGQGLEPRMHLNSTPMLDTTRVILFDPVIASGNAASLALQLLRRSGATDLTLITFVGSLPGLSRLQSAFPDLQIWTAGIDAELDLKHGPVPGIGNFAERLFG